MLRHRTPRQDLDLLLLDAKAYWLVACMLTQRGSEPELELERMRASRTSWKRTIRLGRRGEEAF